MPLFEVAVLEKPAPSKAKDGAVEKLVMPPKHIVAADEQAAGFMIARDKDLPDDIDASRLEVLIRPFG